MSGDELEPIRLSPEALKVKYPTSRHAPKPDCTICHGRGERWVQASGLFSAKWKPCMCIFVEHEHVGLVSEMFQDVVKREKAKLLGENREGKL